MGNWRKVVNSFKLSVIRQISTKDLMYNTMTIANPAVQYIGKLSREFAPQRKNLFSFSFVASI